MGDIEIVTVKGLGPDAGREFHISERDLVLLHLGCNIILSTMQGHREDATTALTNVQGLGGFGAIADAAARVYEAATGKELPPAQPGHAPGCSHDQSAAQPPADAFSAAQKMLEAATGQPQSQPASDYEMPGYL